MAWTDEQLAAMQKNCGNLLVAAGAGSGKTAVLIERIMGIITDEEQPVDVDNLLVLTYTNAAAAEMRQRLIKALRERLNTDPENNYLSRQLVLLQRAKIMTLHSFCLDLLKEYGYALGLDPKSHIGSEGELSILRERVLEDVFEDEYNREDSGLCLLLRHYSRGIGDDNIKELVLRLIEFGESMPDIEGWLDGLAEVYRSGEPTAWLEYFGGCLEQEIWENVNILSAACRLAAEAEGLEKYLPVLQNELLALSQVAGLFADDNDEKTGANIGENTQNTEKITEKLLHVLNELENVDFKRLPGIRAKDGVDVVAQERVKQLRNRVKDGVKGILRESASILHGDLSEELQVQAPLAEALCELAAAYYQAWQQAKRRSRLWEFSDLEHYALKLLQNEELGVAAALRERFFEILVDEYQDINEVQETLLRLLTNGHNRFMVGDIKQSIYRFRLAEPSLFLAKFEDYGQGNGGRRIDLNKNFRSQAGVLAGVNFIFAQLMSGGNLEINYDDAAVLHCGRPELEQLANEFIIIDKASVKSNEPGTKDDEIGNEISNEATGESEPDEMTSADGENWLADMQTVELEANLLAEKIQAELAGGRTCGDIVILLRAVKSWAPIISRVLREHEIPCFADGSDDFMTLPEVQVVYNLLTVLDNPRQDIPLAAVLHSPLVGLSLAELADLHLLDRDSLYEGLKKSHESRALTFLLRLDDWRQRSREMGVFELLEYIYNETALPELLGSLPGGALRRRNLADIQRLALEYDGSGGIGLGRFLKFLAAGSKNLGAKQTDGGTEAVTIMSTHKSKGLEFPVVFVAGLGTSFNEDDFRRDILLHRSLGLGLRRVDLENRRKYTTFGFNIIARKSRWENLAEALRILYVAMTRAESKLYLVGTVASEKALCKALSALPEEKAAECVVSPGFLVQNRSFLPWVAAALLRHSDGGLLRELAGWGEGAVERDLPGGDGAWHVEIVKKLAPPVEALEQQTFNFADWLGYESAADPADNNMKETIRQALARQYPAAELSRLPVKWSATAFAHLEPDRADDDQNGDLYAASLDDAQSASVAVLHEEYAENQAATQTAAPHDLSWYAEYGRIIHALLEKADLVALRSGVSPQQYLSGLLAEIAGDFDEQIVAAVRPEMVAAFFKSDLGRRLLVASENAAEKSAENTQILREQRFIANVRLDELVGLDSEAADKLANVTGLDLTAHADEGLFFQGVIDLAFCEHKNNDNGWVLVDYKSGGNLSKTDDDVRRQYGLQLGIYRKALQDATGQVVKEGWIYFTANGRSVRIF
jgi:ATP-dependent helicase/nuclease subunit A